MTRLLLLTTLLFAVAQTACSTIYFHNGAESASSPIDVGPDQLHHVMLGGIEVSDPPDLNAECDGRGWDTVKSERTFAAGLANYFLAPIYTPWGVAWKCKQIGLLD